MVVVVVVAVAAAAAVAVVAAVGGVVVAVMLLSRRRNILFPQRCSIAMAKWFVCLLVLLTSLEVNQHLT